MKIGFNLLLWTTHFGEENFPVLEKLKAVGYDGVEVPIFDTSDPEHFKKMGQVLKDNGLECTAVTVCPDEAHSAISPDAASRQGAVDHIKRVMDCGANIGAQVLCGPYYQALGKFTGQFPSDDERARAAEVHREVAGYAQERSIKCAIEALNRFEAHFLNTMEQARAYVELVDHPNFGTMYDTFHANIEEKDPVGAIDTVFPVLNHVHISENDRGTPGRGHIDIKGAITKLKSLNYSGWMTIEAFGAALPDLAAATCVWRNFFPNDEQVYTEGFQLIKETWG
ncbi:MAG: sugar phosphate isomerase/epimerase [Verrucomicrobiales bacterium]